MKLYKILLSGIEQEHPLFIEHFPICELSLSKSAIKSTLNDIKNGKLSKTNSPIEIMYNISNNQFLITDGYHRVVQAIEKGNKNISVNIWSTKYSDYYASINSNDLFFNPKKSSLMDTDYIWVPCGLCRGRGIQTEYEDTWECPPCNGAGGSWALQ